MNTPTNLGLFNLFVDITRPGDTELRRAIAAAWRLPEPQAVAALLGAARLPAAIAGPSADLARQMVSNLRQRKAGVGRAGLVQNLLQEYALSSQEGVVLMCLAEALLRIPDSATRDALIRDKIAQGQWQTHLGKSASLFVNAATWGLLITGKLVATHSEAGLGASVARLVGMGGEPLIRKGVDMAMRMMSEQFVTGETIHTALDHAAVREQEGFRYSFDMLGEAALTAQDAARYLGDYEKAIHAIGKASHGRGIFDGPGISIKLSALHPRYSRAQYDRVMGELYPVLVQLCALTKRYDIGLNIDAEEADRLDIFLDLLEQLCFEPQLQGWMGLGFVIQAYQKRCPAVIDHVVDLARRSQRRLMIRLVKGAYWDSEIKRAQVDGQDGYPVYTRKPYTDAAYIACARKLLAALDAVYPQFATHNALTLASVYQLAGPATWHPHQYEFQCLHGMGEPLYEQVVGDTAQGKLGRPCRIYAPVGTHETLLAYLVRRLLENGANTSFVNRIADPAVSLDELVEEPTAVINRYALAEGTVGLPHPAIPLPRDLYGPTRRNSAGIDLAHEFTLQQLAADFQATATEPFLAMPMIAAEGGAGETYPVINPAWHADVVGAVRNATPEDIAKALQAATDGAQAWAQTSPAARAACLDKATSILETQAPRLMAILVREAGKTAANAVAEVREAVDFLRYYARQVREQFDNATHVPLGPVVCISPWNFPLAIFMGQVSAALAAGNVVLAKPAEQTPLIAAEGVRALWAAGVPRAAVQLLPGRGSVVGAALVADTRVQGILFTGSTEVAKILQQGIVGRLDAQGRAIPLIAETGGQNAMIVDSSALAEQVVADVVKSAFDSAGQRCSALRVLCVQEEAVGRIRDMLLGAMAELRVGRPDRFATDVGPVIDAEAKAGIAQHIATMRAKERKVYQVAGRNEHALEQGSFVLPTLIEIESVSELEREVFGPVLHLVRYPRDKLDGLLASIDATGYGLTMGLHTRIDETITRVAGAAHVGNLYVNRDMVGAVVGVQPFGGEGLSGTGPKAGGPLYLYRLLQTKPQDALEVAVAGAAGGSPTTLRDTGRAFQSLSAWADQRSHRLAQHCARLKHLGERVATIELTGPTGERNTYSLHGRTGVLCLARSEDDRLAQLVAVLAVGARPLLAAEDAAVLTQLPDEVRSAVVVITDRFSASMAYDLVLLHGSVDELCELQNELLRRSGPIVAVERLNPGDWAIPAERLVLERAMSVNTAAAGGNASLMMIS